MDDEPADVIAAERARIATEGWGARLLNRMTVCGEPRAGATGLPVR